MTRIREEEDGAQRYEQFLHCWLGHVTCKIVSEMTYNVSSGTLNFTIPYHTIKVEVIIQRVQEAVRT